ncbi:unnamed protein product [Blumeria hordei]|uniref:Alpha-tubulin suppressor protein Aats1 n=2 Tax=Blumeria hordei TaxID=2867405 RepID=A0A383UWY5_BLUHO|nr:alpha-tubulin suppressor protein Aats1 [Blumeria hordei DH14]SZF04256.1 unnamed protein product [Blumeria hordei]
MIQLYSLGSNGSGKLAIGHTHDVSVPKETLFHDGSLEESPLIISGGNHTLVLASGVIYSCGDARTGACGDTGVDTADCKFHLVRLPDQTRPVTLCAASWEATIIVQKDEQGISNKIYTFGTGNKGELGQGELIFRSKIHLIKNFPPQGLEVKHVAGSVCHFIAVLSNGDVYGWGNGRKGQLGSPEKVVYEPRKITGLDFNVVYAVCGRDFTCLLGDPKTGRYIILGSDRWGLATKGPPDLRGWKDVGAGWGSIHVLNIDGSLVSWGRDSNRQLSSPSLPPLEQIAVGSEHSLGLTVDGNVLAWGWGEHGNCGPATKENEVERGWNVIAASQNLNPGSRIASIGAGCATSWICIEVT